MWQAVFQLGILEGYRVKTSLLKAYCQVRSQRQNYGILDDHKQTKAHCYPHNTNYYLDEGGGGRGGGKQEKQIKMFFNLL